MPFDSVGWSPGEEPESKPGSKLDKAAAALMLGMFVAVLGASVVVGVVLPLLVRILAYPPS